jgi:hypothetical protein
LAETFRQLRGEGGSWVKLLYFKIWNLGVQELFTEFKKLVFRISNIIQNGLRISQQTIFSDFADPIELKLGNYLQVS